MELLTGGELLDRLLDRGKYSEVDAAGAFSQMCEAINYLQTRRTPIVHMDLKLENWLYTNQDSDELKLIDFGISMEWNRQSQDPLLPRTCTREYAPPEQIQQKKCTEKCDIFSLGVILYILLTGHPPFAEATKQELQRMKVYQMSRQFLNLSEDSKNLLTSMLAFDPTRRPSAKAILKDRWLKATKQDAVVEPMHPEVISGIRASQIQRKCVNMLAWSVSATDIQVLQTCFAQFDTNQAGNLSLNEFRSVLEEKCSIHSVEAIQIFASIQKEDNPGEICYTEFLAALMRERIRLHRQSLHSLWMSLSGCDEGEILVSSLRTMLLPNDPQTMLPDETNSDAATVEALLQELDPSCTGEILFSSFQALISSLVTCPKADLGVADEERQRRSLN